LRNFWYRVFIGESCDRVLLGAPARQFLILQEARSKYFIVPAWLKASSPR